MIKIAVLITCFNRKNKTISCIKDIYQQIKDINTQIDIYITDGGSSDGTPDYIKKYYPEINLYIQEGLFWAGGMRFSWGKAITNKDYDYFWLVNDDTHLYKDCLSILLDTEKKCNTLFGKYGIYIGSTKDPNNGQFTYGGKKLEQWGNNKSITLYPNGLIQKCDLGNANIMLIHNSVFNKIGGLSEKYTHGIADYDYTLRAAKANIPVLVAPLYCGECLYDHGNNWLSNSSFRKRLSFLYSPKGLAYKEYLYFIKTFFPKQYPIAFIKLWLKTLCPSLWNKFKK